MANPPMAAVHSVAHRQRMSAFLWSSRLATPPFASTLRLGRNTVGLLVCYFRHGTWQKASPQQDKSARKEFFYFNDDGQLVAMRYENWKFVFCEQRVEGTLRVWAEPFVCLRKTYRSACKRNGGKAA